LNINLDAGIIGGHRSISRKKAETGDGEQLISGLKQARVDFPAGIRHKRFASNFSGIAVLGPDKGMT
jgi:hypothetical protein